jgi:hypothetical protein
VCRLVVVGDLIGRVDDLRRRGAVAECRPDLIRRPEEDAVGTPVGCFGGRGRNFGQAAIGAERVYRDCCDEPSGEPPSATTWRPP